MRARNQGTNELTRAKPVGHPDSHPRPLTKEAIPINKLCPPCWIVRGPPESPLQAPRLLSPEVQTMKKRIKYSDNYRSNYQPESLLVLSWMIVGKRIRQAVLLMTSTWTNLKNSEDCAPAEKRPQPEAIADEPAKVFVPSAKLITWTNAFIVTGVGNWMIATSLTSVDGL